MVKKPDLSDLTRKFDLDKILGGLKSMINPAGGVPDVDPNDALGLKIAQLSALFQEMAKSHAELAKDFHKANEILNSLFKDLESVRASKGPSKPGPTSSPGGPRTPGSSGSSESRGTTGETTSKTEPEEKKDE